MKIKKSFFRKKYLLIIPLIFAGFFLVNSATKASGIEDEICDWSGGWVGCESESSFTEFKGLYLPPNPKVYVANPEDPAAGSIFKCFTFKQCVMNYTNFALGFLGFAAVIVIIYGGFQYVLSGGENEKTEKGKKNIMYAVIGILIVMISYAIVNTVMNYAPTGSQDPGNSKETNGPIEKASPSDIVVSSSSTKNAGSSIESQVYNLYGGIQNSYKAFVEIKSDIETNYQILSDNSKNAEALESNPSSLNKLVSDTKNFYKSIQQKSMNLGKLAEESQIAVQNIDMELSIANNTTYFEPQKNNYYVSLIPNVYAREETPPTPQLTKAEIENLLKIMMCDLNRDKSTECPSTSKVNIYKANRTDYDNIVKDSVYSIASLYLQSYKGYIKTDSSIGKAFTDSIKTLPADENALKTIKDINVETSPETLRTNYGTVGNLTFVDDTKTVTSTDMKAATDSLYMLEKEINKLKATEAVIKASSISGPAPLVVMFDGTGSKDPANTTIADTKYTWDLGNPSNSECDTKNGSATSCIYEKPGSYTVSLKVDSSSSEIISSTVYLKIQVSPPKSKLKLDVGQASNMKTVADYADYNNPLTNVNSYKTTLNIAKDTGIIFDASGTKDAFSGDTIKAFEFDFGDSSAKVIGAEKKIIHKYKKAGNYKLVLTVKDGKITDSKVLNVRIETIVADMRITPKTGETGTIIELDASGSKSDTAAIKSWIWSFKKYVKKQDNTFDYVDTVDSDFVSKSDNFTKFAEAETVQVAFANPGMYQSILVIQDESSPNAQTDTVTDEILIKSKKPKANFSYNFPVEEKEPGKVAFTQLSYDRDPNDVLSYKWSVGSGGDGIDYKIDSTKNLTTQNPEITFYKTGTYDVTLEVADQHPASIQEKDSITQSIKIDKVLGVKVTAYKDNSQANIFMLTDEVKIKVESQPANLAEINYGDGVKEEKELINGLIEFTHKYKESGVKNIKVTVYDDKGNDNSLTKVIKISKGDSPIASFLILKDDFEIADSFFDKTFISQKIYRSANMSFDASSSINVDGSNRKLEYIWNIYKAKSTEDCKNGSIAYKNYNGKVFATKFADLGKYFVQLEVRNKGDENNMSEDTGYFGCLEVESTPPILKGLEFTLMQTGSELITPLKVKLRAVGVSDSDGQVVSYLWWYKLTTDSNSEMKGAHTTTTPDTTITVNTYGNEGETKKYNFFVKVTDNENNSTEIQQGPEITVKNGLNKPPAVKVTVDRTNILKGESVNLSANAKDPDGEISRYAWDMEGDLAFNDTCKTSSCVYKYDKKNNKGYEVRVRVADNLGAEATSDPIKIFVDSKTQDPKAGFTYDEPDVGVLTVSLKNESVIDETLNKNATVYKWDSNTNIDTNGDGIKDNDNDSSDENPSFSYKEAGTYEIKLNLTDEEGNSASVVRNINFKKEALSKPKAEFSEKIGEYDSVKGAYTVTFNASASATSSGATIENYYWDFDLETKAEVADINDSLKNLPENNDEKTNNDKQKDALTTTYFYKPGTYSVKLEVVDSKGQFSEITQNMALPKPGVFYPVANFEISSVDQKTKKVIFNASESRAPDNRRIVKYYYDFNLDKEAGDPSFELDSKKVNQDGLTNNDVDNSAKLQQPIGEFTYDDYSDYQVSLTVETDKGERNTTKKTVSIIDPSKGIKPIAYLKSLDVEKENVITGNIQLTGDFDCVNYDYSASGGSGTFTKYIIDTNTNYDLDKDGNSSNDKDFEFANEATLLKICYQSIWGEKMPIITRLTVLDQNGSSSYVDRKIDFEKPVAGQIDARISSQPQPIQGGTDANKVVIYGSEGNVSFDFGSSIGEGLQYLFDNNIYYDSNGNNIKDDDYMNLKLDSNGKPEKITQLYKREFGKIKARLVLIDKYGQKDQADLEIIFKDISSTSILDVISLDVLFYIVALMGIFGIVSFGFKKYFGKNEL